MGRNYESLTLSYSQEGAKHAYQLLVGRNYAKHVLHKSFVV